MHRRHLGLALICIVVLLGPAAGTAFATPAGWSATPVPCSSEDCHNTGLRVSGNRLAWLGGESPSLVYTWKAGDSAQKLVSTTALGAYEPSISGDRLAWFESRAAGLRVATWKAGDSAPTNVAPLTDTSYGPPVASGDRIFWIDKPASSPHVYTANVGDASPVQLSGTHQTSDLAAADGRATWVESDGSSFQIQTWKVGDGAPTPLTSGTNVHLNPQVSGDRVVWNGQSDDLQWHTYTWALGDSQPTTVGPAVADDHPQISGSRIVWLNSDGSDNQVVTWAAGDSALTTVTTTSRDHHDPVVSGDRIAWLESNGSGDQVMTWKLGDAHPAAITATWDSNGNLTISGNRLAWTEFDGNGGAKLFTAATSSAPASTQLTKPVASSTTPKKGKSVTFSANLTPKGAASAAGAKVYLYRRETHTVTKVVNGVSKRVTEKYWHLRLKPGTAHSAKTTYARLAATTKLAYRGSWRAIVKYSACTEYKGCSSPALYFTVK